MTFPRVSGGERSFEGPPTIYPASYGGFRYSGSAGPALESERSLSNSEKSSVASVFSLFFWGSPPTIFGAVSEVVVNSIERASRRAWSHITRKRTKTIHTHPLTADVDAPPTVPVESLITRVGAPIVHRSPYFIYRMVAAAMRNTCGTLSAPTRYSRPSTEGFGGSFARGSAKAQTNPQPQVFAVAARGGDSKTTESVADEVERPGNVVVHSRAPTGRHTAVAKISSGHNSFLPAMANTAPHGLPRLVLVATACYSEFSERMACQVNKSYHACLRLWLCGIHYSAFVAKIKGI